MIAFPGAEGFGANSVGGQGGEIYEVTNLNNSGVGSFREAVEASGARIVEFSVSGTIVLTSKLQVINPYITIAGQTAPGGGICLKGSGTWNGSCLAIGTHNVIVRYIRVRQGAMTNTANSRDGILIGSATPGVVHDVIVDHCSISWATDENVTIWWDPYDVTVQWCIISEGLHDSTHTGGPHSMGVLVGGTGVTNISLHHNLIAHNNSRSPRCAYEGTHDIVNNVIYNPGAEIGSFKNDTGDLLVNYVNNYIRRGGDSDGGSYEMAFAAAVGSNNYIIYVNGNIGPNRITDDLDEDLVVLPAFRSYVTATRNTAPLIITTSAIEAYEQVVMNAGAILPVRDIVDKRIVNDVINVTGGIIDDPSEVRGWPDLSYSEWHGYIGIENMNLSGGQVDILLDELKSIGPDSSYLFSQFLPERVCHWYASGDLTILEALFNENNLTITKFKERLGEILTIDPDVIGHTIIEEDYAGYGTDAVVFESAGTDYFRFLLFGGTDTAWMESGDECRGYL